MKRDRDGSPIEEADDGPPPPSDAARYAVALLDAARRELHDCKRGWVGEDGEGRPVPCLVCKPHLVKRMAVAR